MIKFHYHTAPRDVPDLGVARGDRLCHVYSDESVEELHAWGDKLGLRAEWIDGRALPHYDAFGDRLSGCGPAVSRRELVEDIRLWRRKG